MLKLSLIGFLRFVRKVSYAITLSANSLSRFDKAAKLFLSLQWVAVAFFMRLDVDIRGKCILGPKEC